MSDEKVLTKDVAEQFLADEDSVDLNGFASIDDAAAEILNGYSGDLMLESMANLSVTAATFLAGHKNGDLWMDGITNLSVELATVLIQHPGRLTFDGFQELSVELADALAARTGPLALNGIVNMTTDVAEILGGSNMTVLELFSLSSLLDAAAESLSRHKGKLELNLGWLPKSAAAILRKHPSFADED